MSIVFLFATIPVGAAAQRHVHLPKHLTVPAPTVSQTAVADTGRSVAYDDFVDVTEEPLLLHPLDSGLRYPPAAAKAGVQGSVKMAALIELDGSVGRVVIQQSDSKLLNDEAVRLMRLAKFKPAMQQDKPLRVWISDSIEFKPPGQH